MHKLFTLLAFASIATAQQVQPAATLLLPRFEVSDDQKFDTIMKVTNSSDAARVARFTIHSERGFALVWFPLTIAPGETKSIAVGDLLFGKYVTGREAGHPLCAGDYFTPVQPDCRGYIFVHGPIAMDLRCLLKGGSGSDYFRGVQPQPVSSRHSHSIGYIVIDVVKDEQAALDDKAPVETANVLSGSFEQRANGTLFSSGSLRANERKPKSMKARLPRDPNAKPPDPQCHSLYM